jgi:predicted nucleotidyltransferase
VACWLRQGHTQRVPLDPGIQLTCNPYQALARCEELSRSSQKKQALYEEAQKREEALLREARHREEAHELRLQVALGDRDEALAQLTAAAIHRRASKRDAWTEAGVRTADKVSE